MASSRRRVGPPIRTVTAVWTIEHENIYLDLMINQVKKGNLVTTTFSRKTWKEIYDGFLKRTHKAYNAKQFRNKYNKLRQRYRDFKALTEQSGFVWEPVTNIVTADDHVWDEYIKTNQSAKIFRVKGCSEYPKLCILFGDASATGNDTWSSFEEATSKPHRETEHSDTGVVVETQNYEIPTNSASPLTYNIEPTPIRQQKISKGNSISEAAREVTVAPLEKYNKQDTSSSNPSSFSISACMAEMKKYGDVPMLKRLKATKELQYKNWRETFMCMDEEMRRAWMESLE